MTWPHDPWQILSSSQSNNEDNHVLSLLHNPVHGFSSENSSFGHLNNWYFFMEVTRFFDACRLKKSIIHKVYHWLDPWWKIPIGQCLHHPHFDWQLTECFHLFLLIFHSELGLECSSISPTMFRTILVPKPKYSNTSCAVETMSNMTFSGKYAIHGLSSLNSLKSLLLYIFKLIQSLPAVHCNGCLPIVEKQGCFSILSMIYRWVMFSGKNLIKNIQMFCISCSIIVKKNNLFGV